MSVIEVWFALIDGNWFRVLHVHADGVFEVSEGWDPDLGVHTIVEVPATRVIEVCQGVDALPLVPRPTAAFDAELPF